MPLTIAIAGRPNVGKSTLFNRLVGKSMALVSDESGVTRDWREGEGSLIDLKLRVLDTAGLEDTRPKGSLAERTAARTREALAQTDVILLVVDARVGLTADDKAVAREIRKTGKPIILVANKCEGTYLPDTLDEMGSLGFGEPVALSAAHAEGMTELYEALEKYALESEKHDSSAGEDEEDEKNLHVAIVGRPNAGKSTLLNRFIGEERMLTGPEPGLTRDAVPVLWKHKGKTIRLVDTAGLRRRARVSGNLEKLSTQETIRAIRLAHVVILVIDAMQPFDKQDLIIAKHVADEGRGLVVAVNKWDTAEDKKLILKNIRAKAEASLAQVAGVPLIPCSALTGEGMDELIKAVLKIYSIWNLRISTGKLNRWLEDMETENPPPITSGRRIKLRYMTQVKSRPPTFALWVNKPVDLPDSYQRFLTNGLRKVFKFEGVPIRWQLKKSANPYEGKSKRN
jgi:GTP-binding protein